MLHHDNARPDYIEFAQCRYSRTIVYQGPLNITISYQGEYQRLMRIYISTNPEPTIADELLP